MSADSPTVEHDSTDARRGLPRPRAGTRRAKEPVMRRSILAFALAVAGCVGTPVPQPPALDPPDATRIVHEMVGSVPELRGEPGAAEPGTTLWIVNLDRADDPVTAIVEPDGSFSVFVLAMAGEELRVQARDGDDRSRPLDLLVPRGEIARPTEGCLALEPALELRLADPVDVGATSAGTVRVSNECGAEVRLDAVELRRPSSAWTVETPGPVAIPAGGATDLRVRFAPGSAGSDEEILFLRVGAPDVDRRPITLSGVGR